MAPTLLDFTMTSVKRQRPIVVRVVDDPRSESDSSPGDIDDLVRVDDPFLESCTGRHDLERGTRLVKVLHGPVAPLLHRSGRERIRIERRFIGQRENLSGPGVHDDDGPAGRPVACDRIMKLALGHVLQDTRQSSARPWHPPWADAPTG